jgi:hypothetical protein
VFYSGRALFRNILFFAPESWDPCHSSSKILEWLVRKWQSCTNYNLGRLRKQPLGEEWANTISIFLWNFSKKCFVRFNHKQVEGGSAGGGGWMLNLAIQSTVYILHPTNINLEMGWEGLPKPRSTTHRAEIWPNLFRSGLEVTVTEFCSHHC